ncbi:MAG: hypothetical protein NVSMB7_15060 [Chitinophagaceae bacterium]
MGLSVHNEISGLIRLELDRLDKQPVLMNGKLVKPSQCYRYSTSPPHVLYNTNCPEHLMEKIEAILLKYRNTDEGRA